MKDLNLKWRLINFVQVMCIFVWTAALITIALVLRVVTGGAKAPLMFAHRAWGPGVMFFSGSRYKVKGLQNVPLNSPCIFLMNHQSAFDIPLIFAALPLPLRFIVKKELRKIPFLGWYIDAMGMVFIDRSDREKAIDSLKEAGRIIRSGAHILAYPEGTRTYDGSLLPFKKGPFVLAIEAGVPVIPVAIEGSQKALPRNTFSIRPENIRLNIGRPILTSLYTLETKEILMRRVREEMVALHKEIGGLGDDQSGESVVESDFSEAKSA